MPKPVCVKCQCFYRPEKNGFCFIEGKPDGLGNLPNEEIRGTRLPEAWTPYKLWMSDKWKCPDCGHEILTGFGACPISEHYLPDFEAKVALTKGDQLQVNDC